MEIFKKLHIEFDFERLLDEAKSLINEIGWHNNQISLQYSEEESWEKDVDWYRYTRKEHLCTNWNSRLWK